MSVVSSTSPSVLPGPWRSDLSIVSPHSSGSLPKFSIHVQASLDCKLHQETLSEGARLGVTAMSLKIAHLEKC